MGLVSTMGNPGACGQVELQLLVSPRQSRSVLSLSVPASVLPHSPCAPGSKAGGTAEERSIDFKTMRRWRGSRALAILGPDIASQRTCWGAHRAPGSYRAWPLGREAALLECQLSPRQAVGFLWVFL